MNRIVIKADLELLMGAMKKTKSIPIEVQEAPVFNPNFNYGEFAIIRSQAGLNWLFLYQERKT